MEDLLKHNIKIKHFWPGSEKITEYEKRNVQLQKQITHILLFLLAHFNNGSVEGFSFEFLPYEITYHIVKHVEKTRGDLDWLKLIEASSPKKIKL